MYNMHIFNAIVLGHLASLTAKVESVGLISFACKTFSPFPDCSRPLAKRERERERERKRMNLSFHSAPEN
jgi:hypothetical protein